MSKVEQAVNEAKRALMIAQDKLEEAAELCNGSPLQDHLNSYYDTLEDIRFDVGKKYEEHKQRLRGEGGGMPKSWRDSA